MITVNIVWWMLTMLWTMWTRELISTMSTGFLNGIGIMQKLFVIGLCRMPHAGLVIGATPMRCGMKFWISFNLWSGDVLRIPLSQSMNWVFISGWKWNPLLLRWSKDSAVAYQHGQLDQTFHACCQETEDWAFSKFGHFLIFFGPENVPSGNLT